MSDTVSVLYIAGPMTGYQDKNAAAFLHAEERLASIGYTVLSPWSLEGDGTQTWHWYMREGLRMLLRAEGVAVLEDWHCSVGAMLEVQVAQALQMPVKPVLRWAPCLMGE